MSDIDLAQYTRPPVMDVRGAVSLGVSLLSAAPKDAPAPVKASAKRLRTSVVALQTAWGLAEAPMGVATTKRAADIATDNAWGCTEGRLDSYARLPASIYPKATRAREIHSVVFSKGLAFLTLDFPSQWAEGDRMLKLIAERGYEDDIDAIAGPEFLAEIKRTHAIYGKVLGVTQAADMPPEVRLAGPLRDVGAAIVGYSLQLLAYAAAEPKAEASVRKALRPIDNHRAAVARRAAGGSGSGAEGESEAAPQEPAAGPKTTVPEVPE